MNPRDTAQLLEAALPPIPSELRPPPYASIRRRVRRRRLTVAAAALGVVTVLGASVLIRTPDPSTVDVAGPPPAWSITPTAGVNTPAVTTGKDLTISASPSP